MKLFFFIIIFNAIFIFDESHQEGFSVRDMCESGYSTFASTLVSMGHVVRVNHEDLLNLLDRLKNGDIVVLPPASYNPMKKEEIEKVKKFVEDGGSLLIIGEHFYPSHRMQVFSHSIASSFGYEFTDGCIFPPSEKKFHGFIDTLFSPLFKIRNITTGCAGFFKNLPDGDVILQSPEDTTPPSAIAGHCRRYGNGKVCVLTDPEVFSNDFFFFGSYLSSNREFIIKISNYLSDIHGKPSKKLNQCLYERKSKTLIFTLLRDSVLSEEGDGFMDFIRDLGIEKLEPLCSDDVKRVIILSPFIPTDYIKSIIKKNVIGLIAFDRCPGTDEEEEKAEFYNFIKNKDILLLRNFNKALKEECGAGLSMRIILEPLSQLYLRVEGVYNGEKIIFLGASGVRIKDVRAAPLVFFSEKSMLSPFPLNWGGDEKRVAIADEYRRYFPVGAAICKKFIISGDTDIFTNYGKKFALPFYEDVVRFLKTTP
jgi:hypothetical protein